MEFAQLVSYNSQKIAELLNKLREGNAVGKFILPKYYFQGWKINFFFPVSLGNMVCLNLVQLLLFTFFRNIATLLDLSNQRYCFIFCTICFLLIKFQLFWELDPKIYTTLIWEYISILSCIMYCTTRKQQIWSFFLFFFSTTKTHSEITVQHKANKELCFLTFNAKHSLELKLLDWM